MLDHPLLFDEDRQYTEFEVWCWLLLSAAWRDTRRRVAGRTIDLRRGQLAHSRRFLARRWRWTEGKVRRFLDRIAADGMIDPKTDSGITVITICNFDAYQLDAVKTGPASGPTPAQDRPKVEEGNKVSGGDSAPAPRKFTISKEALRVADALAVECGIPADEVQHVRGFDQCAEWVQRCLDANWPAELMIATARRVARDKSGEPIRYYQYLRKPIERAVLEFFKPLPTVGVSPDATAQRAFNMPTVIDGGRQQQRPSGGGFAELRARLRRGGSLD